MNYIQYIFLVTPVNPGSEILIAHLSELNFESFVNTETGFEAYIQKQNENEQAVQNLQFEAFNYTYTRKEIEQQNWNALWEESFNPVEVNSDLLIRAQFHQSNSAFKHQIIITPKMSFGTGHHDTTWLMCYHLLKSNVQNKNVIDIGSGTGILAILAHKLKASHIVGIDIDEWSIENAKENAQLNNTSNITFKLETIETHIQQNTSFDVALANINKNTLLKEKQHYYNILKNEGLLFISGFFKFDILELRIAFETVGFTYVLEDIKNDWATLQFKKI